MQGSFRADFNPAYGLLVIPLVFLARLNAIGSLVLVIVFSVIQIGGESAARQAEITTDVLLVLVGLMLLFMALTEYVRTRRGLGCASCRRSSPSACARPAAGRRGRRRAAAGGRGGSRTREGGRMSDLLSEEFLTALISGGLVAAMPLLFASLGELVSEQAGVLNVGLEGYMLFGAFFAFVIAYNTGSEWLGLRGRDRRRSGGGAADGRLLGPHAARPDRDRDRDHPARRGRDQPALRRQLRRVAPAAGAAVGARDPGAEGDPDPRRERLQPAPDRLRRDRARLRHRLDPEADLGRAQHQGRRRAPGGARRRRGQRDRDPYLGDALRAAGSPGSAAPTWRSSAPAASPRSSPRAPASSRS